MKSMTGFATGEREQDGYHVTLEFKAYNNRFLDLSISTTQQYSAFEPRVRAFVTERVHRGKIDITVRIREIVGEPALSFDRANVIAYAAALREIASIAGTAREITLADILRLDGVLTVDRSKNVEVAWRVTEGLLDEAFSRFELSRRTEGESLGRDLATQISIVESAVASIERLHEQIEDGITTTVRARFDEILGDRVNEDRMLAEVASLLVKHSINEEVIRLRGHIDAFKAAMREEGPIGKRLDFICQELNREINTTGSKSVLYGINRHVVDVKEAIENIREQTRNIE